MTRRTYVLTAVFGLLWNWNVSWGQDRVRTRDILDMVARSVIHDATFQFVDTTSGRRFVRPSDAPSDAQLELESRYNDWRYWNGVLNIAMMRLGESLHDSTYENFVSKNLAFCFDNYPFFEARHTNEGKWEYPFGQFFMMEELDDCGAMGASLIEVYRHDPQPRYHEYIQKAAGHVLERQSRLEDRTLVRTFPQQWTLWADDLYMSVVFLSRMGALENDGKFFDDAAREVMNFHRYLFDETKGAMHHCWYSQTSQKGVAIWGRANGWALLAQVDLLDRIPQDLRYRDTLIALFRNHVRGIARYQSSSGLWHQLIDKEDSYLETSCSAMFTYAVARGVNMGYLDSGYVSVAQQGWEGVLSRIRADGQIEGVCAGTGVSDDLKSYYFRPTPLNDVHGVGVVLLAGSEILGLKQRKS